VFNRFPVESLSIASFIISAAFLAALAARIAPEFVFMLSIVSLHPSNLN
jgi:hypothetical protein